jgi:hypothetical protein
LLTSGKLILAGKIPFSKHVPSGPVIKQSHSKKLSSDDGPAAIPSGGLALISRKRLDIIETFVKRTLKLSHQTLQRKSSHF